MGARFDRTHDGQRSLTREGGHHRDRIAYAGGDATGAEIVCALVTPVLDATEVDVIEHALVLDLLVTPTGGVAGVTLHVMGEGRVDTLLQFTGLVHHQHNLLVGESVGDISA